MKYALVTGGSRGIGRAVSIKLAQMGYRIIINYVNNTTAAEETLQLVREAGSDGEMLKFNVGDASQVKEAIEACNYAVIGYISVIQMETAAMIGAEHTADNAAKALCASAKERYGWDVIDFDEARDVVITATLGNGRERSFQAFAQYVGSRVGLELEVTEDDFQAIFDDARKAVAVTIPVYEENGETVIGEYIVNRL